MDDERLDNRIRKFIDKKMNKYPDLKQPVDKLIRTWR